jgi:hypothetical protein
MPLTNWMQHANRFNRPSAWQRRPCRDELGFRGAAFRRSWRLSFPTCSSRAVQRP